MFLNTKSTADHATDTAAIVPQACVSALVAKFLSRAVKTVVPFAFESNSFLPHAAWVVTGRSGEGT